MKKTKKAMILTSALATTALCASLVAGGTFALFSSDDSVDITVTAGAIDVKTSISAIEAYSPEQIDLDTYLPINDVNGATTAEDKMSGTFHSGGTVKVSGRDLVVENMVPGDKVTVTLSMDDTNSTVKYNYRVKLGCKNGDSALANDLLVSVDDVYYADLKSDWTESSKLKDVKVEIELPTYVGNYSAIETCTLGFVVEAVQSNAVPVGKASAVRTYLVNTQDELDAALDTAKDGETLVLMGGNGAWTTADIAFAGEKTLNVRGYNVGTLNIDAPDGTVHYYNAVTDTVNIDSVAGESFHVYGAVKNMLTVKAGHAVVEQSANVANVSVAPAANKTAKLSVKSNIGDIKVEGEGTADIQIDEGIVTGDIAYDVYTAEALTAALTSGEAVAVTLMNDVELDKYPRVNSAVSIDLNGHTLTVNNSISLSKQTEIRNGNLILNITSASDVKAMDISGVFDMKNVDYSVKLTSTKEKRSQSLVLMNIRSGATVNSADSNISGEVVEKNEACTITMSGCYVYSGSESVINGGSITGEIGVYMMGTDAAISLSGVTINYTTAGLDMRYNGGQATLGAGVMFVGPNDAPSIRVGARKAYVLNDGESGYIWELSERIADCAGYDPIIEVYKSGNASKWYYTDDVPEHECDVMEYEDGFYVGICKNCGTKDYMNMVKAGSSEKYYYPVKDLTGLINAALNAESYIKLENDITVNKYTSIEMLDGCTLDLNGKTVTVNKSCDFVISGKNITVKNGKMVATAGNSYAVRVANIGNTASSATLTDLTLTGGINIIGSDVTVNNCSADANGLQYYGLYVSKASGYANSTATVTVNGGTYGSGTYGIAVYADEGATVTVNGATLDGETHGSVTVNN